MAPFSLRHSSPHLADDIVVIPFRSAAHHRAALCSSSAKKRGHCCAFNVARLLLLKGRRAEQKPEQPLAALLAAGVLFDFIVKKFAGFLIDSVGNDLVD